MRECFKRLLDLWPTTVAALGFIALGVEGLLDPPRISFMGANPLVWVVIPVIVGLTVIAAILNRINPTVTAAITVAYAFFRGVSYISLGLWNPLFVWIIVAALSIAVWRQRRQLERHGLDR